MTYETAPADPRNATVMRRPTSWGAIFVGVVIVIAIQILLSMLGLSLGLHLIEPHREPNAHPFAIAVGAALWWLVSGVLAFGFGAFGAAWLRRTASTFDAVLHGLATWGIVVLVTFALLSSAVGGMIGGLFHVAAFSAHAGAKQAKALPQMMSMTNPASQEDAKARLDELLSAGQDPATMNPQDASKAVNTQVAKLERGGDDAKQARDRIVAITAAQLKIPETEAAQRFDDSWSKITKAKDDAAANAKQMADRAAAAASKAAFAGFIALLVGAFAAAFGAVVGVRPYAAVYVTRQSL